MRARAAVLAVTVIFATPLLADGPTTTYREWTNLCTTGSFHTCASVTVRVISTQEASVIVISFQNRQGNSYGYDNIGGSTIGYMEARRYQPGIFGFRRDLVPVIEPAPFGNVGEVGTAPNWWDGTHDGIVQLDGTNWSYVGFEPNNAGRGIFGCNPPPMAPVGWMGGGYVTCAQQGYDGWVQVAFAIDVPSSADDWRISWIMSSTDGTPAPSLGCATDGTGGCVTVTPEPVTLSLLATGLAGIGVARRRRRAA